MIKIYKLIRNGEVVYVGKTILTLSRRKAGSYYCMDRQFVKECEIELIEETDDVSRERYWIEFYTKQGCQLRNKRNGDYRDKEQTKEIRSKLRKEARKNRTSWYWRKKLKKDL